MAVIQSVCNFVLIGLLAGITVIDIKKNIIPNRLVLAIAFLSIVRIVADCFFSGTVEPLLSGFLGLLAGGVPFAVIILLTNGAMGAGDMKLYAALGLFFGWRRILYIAVLSILIAGAAALVLLVLKKKDGKSSLVMAPFIAAAALAVMVFEPQINLFLKTFYHI